MLHRIKAPIAFLLFLLACAMPSTLTAGETGKIAGSVTDRQSGQPLLGANVMITAVWQGDRATALGRPAGAVTDLQGQFFILNLPPGYYNVRISYIGYIQQLHEKVQVKIDKTTRLDIALEATALAGEQVVVTAYRPDKVEKDLTATKLTYDVGEVISIAGVASIADILELQADVVDDHFRGGRVGESTYLIGGSAIINPLSNERAFLPIVTALEQVEVYTSGFSAEYGNAQSGVVNMVAKEGKSSWDSRMEFSSTMPYHKSWGGSPYSPENLDYFNLLYDPEEWLKDNPLLPGHPLWENGYGVAKYLPPRIVWPPNPLNHQDSLRMATLGRNLWLQSVRDVGLETKAMDYRFDFTAGGPIARNTHMFLAMRQSMISPLVPTPNPDLERQMLGNVTWQPSADDKIKLSFMYDFSFLNYLDSNWERWIFDRTLSVTKKTNSSLQYGLEWRHLFSPASYGDLNFKILDVRQQDRIELLTDAQYLDDYGNNRNWVDYTSPANQRVGRPNDDRGSQKTRTFSLTSSYTSQINRYNLLKTGLQFYYYDLDVDYQYNATNAQNLQNLTFHSWPFEGALYLQDKMEFEGLIANLGLRFDFYDLNTRYYLDKFYPLRDPEKTRATGLFTRLQPRIGVSFPVSEYSVFHLNYGTFTQRPNFYQLFYNEINDDGGVMTLYTLGNPELKPENTQAYDIGIVRSLAGGFQIDVSAYYKDVKNLVESAFYKTEGGESYRTYINRDYADIKGFHVNFERVTGSLRGYLRYNYEEAKGKNSNPDNLAVPVTFFNYTPSEEELADLAEQRFPEDVFLDYDRKHKVIVNVRYLTGKEAGFELLGFRPLANLSISNTFRYYTGRPYTLPPSLDPFGQALKFSKRTPDERDWRIRLEKRFSAGRTGVTAYLEGFNMLNQKSWSYSRTFNHGRNTVRWHTDRANILTDNEFAPYVTGQELYLLTNEPRHYRMGMVFNF